MMTLEEIKTSLRAARFKLRRASFETDFDSKVKRLQLRDLIADLKRRRKEILEKSND